jgi:TolB-like protein/Tfp pilus assembly protein PilF
MRRGNAVLVVLPIQTPGNMGDEALIAEGLVEDISSELSRFAALDMLAASAGRVVADLGHAEIGERLGVTHVLQGSLRRAGERLRITVRLVECATGTQTWSERFDVPVKEIFAVQDEIVARIAATLVPRLEHSLLAAARRRPADFAVYTLTLEGFARLREGTLEADDAARQHFQSAIESDPAYARAHVGMALSWFNEWSCQFWDRFEENTRKAYTSAHRALALDDRDAHLHQVLGKLHLYWQDWERASWYFDRALELCPNDPELLIQQSLHDAYLGRPEVGIARAKRAMQLNPAYPGYYPGLAALVHLVAGDFITAVELGNRSAGAATVDIPAFWAIACAHLGRIDEARAYFAQYEAEFREKILFGREPQPGEAVAWFFDHNPFRREEHVELLVEGFRRIEAPLPQRGPHPVAELDRPAIFARLGESWIAGYESRQVLLPDLKGFSDIQRLLERPGEEIHCLDLAERVPSMHGGDEMLDDRARAAIKARIRDLQEEIADADDRNDIGRAERLRAEFETLVETLSRALGLGGRSRRLGSLAERARTTVTWRIRHAIRRIEAAHPELGRHFAHSLRTGSFCSYSPERPVAWRLAPEPAAPTALPA